MATHKSAEKRIRVSARRQVVNKAAESRIKSSVKKVLATTNKEEAEKFYKEAVSILDKGTLKGLIKKNTASRKKSLITRHLNSLQKKA
ncbi:MAG: 30S ribosomal protein S20 [bacterium]|nr:30S ribosomal protein S20 [bacterium]